MRDARRASMAQTMRATMMMPPFERKKIAKRAKSLPLMPRRTCAQRASMMQHRCAMVDIEM